MVGGPDIDSRLKSDLRILVIEDEPPIAEDIVEGCRAILGGRIGGIRSVYTMEEAADYIASHPVDLCLLDLNLSGKDGFELLRRMVGHAFHTIIVSAYTDMALEAFEYGVLDFIPKPFDEVRLKKALDRFDAVAAGSRTRYLVVRKRNENHLLPVEDIRFFKAEGYLVEARLRDGRVEILDKPLNRLEQILPDAFVRVHRSYIVRLDDVESYGHTGGGVYRIRLAGGETLPLSRSYRQRLKDRFGG